MRLLLAAVLAAASTLCALGASQTPIVIETDNTALVYTVGNDGRLYQQYLGKRLLDPADYDAAPRGPEAYITAGMEDYYTPALAIKHADGNPSTLLTFKGMKVTEPQPGQRTTVITLTDEKYGDTVDLVFDAFSATDVIKAHSVITNGEKKPLALREYSSAMLHFDRPDYYLTQYNGNWASEARQSEPQRLAFGKKVLDTKLGARAAMFLSPFFTLGLDTPAAETSGDVLVGTLGWTGNFSTTFEVDHQGRLRLVSGINPEASTLKLAAGEKFQTPEFIFTFSDKGTGQASRNLHRWARDYQLHNGNQERMTILNNWEATGCDFDEQKLISILADAKDLGVDLFLLDDGWFGNKYPRSDDHQGLGDWDVTHSKLPNGIGRLTQAADSIGVKFGIWIEPEMVNPRSELYEKHPNWVIQLPNREPYYFRNQMVLDLSNPKVQDFVFSVVDDLMTQNPEIASMKWDCNSPITNIYSQYEGDQDRLYVDYTRGLYNVLERVRQKYPDLDMMMCSGGGGRCDYEGLKYFDHFWASDNTDPEERIYIQWGMSQVFPPKTLCSHVTSWDHQASMKFRTDVALMGKLGFDLKVSDMTDSDKAYARAAVKAHRELAPAISDGDFFRLYSPYDGDHAAWQMLSRDGSLGVVEAFDLHPRYGQRRPILRLQGLDPAARYELQEILRADTSEGPAKTYSGDYLMTVGLPLFTGSELSSRVYRLRRK